MELSEFERLKEKVETLIRFNHSLREQKKAFAEQLRLREKLIRELKERCERYELKQKEACQRIDGILSKLDGVKP